MNVVKNEMTFFVDIDETLVKWSRNERGAMTIIDPNDGVQNRVVPHWPHIKILKNKKTRGAHVVVWSAGGYAWAEAVVTALGLQNYVDQIMTKPSSYMDDKIATEFMGERIYLPIDSNYR
jgi:FMN phosphatase YigB (HAD superfamily)